MRRVVLDLDTGTDDAQAIILAVEAPELKVEAITTVSGNVHVDKTSWNSLKVLELAGITDIPVARGMDKPLVRDYPIPRHRRGLSHGIDGLGNTFLPKPEGNLDEKHAVDLIIDVVMAYPEEVTLIPVGPLTNIAMAVLKEPRVAKEAAELVLMGGAFATTPYGVGNVTPVSEFNFWFDPEAANIVLKAGFRKITCVGLDTTTDPSACIRAEHLEKFSREDPLEDFVVKLNRWRMTQARAAGISHLHDVQAVAYVVDRTLFKTERMFVTIIDRVPDDNLCRGQSIADRRVGLKIAQQYMKYTPSVAEICSAVDGERFLDLYISRVTGREE